MSLSRLSKQDRFRTAQGGSQRGFVMIEMLLAVGIVGTAMLATVAAFSTASRTAAFVDDATTGQWVATSQIEFIKTAAYVLTPGTYASVPVPTDFAVSNATSDVTGGDENIQIVTVIVSRGGETVFETSAMKVNR
ncbi:MAG: type II secretion system protein [Chloroflexi bacterium]|nr:type II secretion system protein [Chloroflexota bacterium]